MKTLISHGWSTSPPYFSKCSSLKTSGYIYINYIYTYYIYCICWPYIYKYADHIYIEYIYIYMVYIYIYGVNIYIYGIYIHIWCIDMVYTYICIVYYIIPQLYHFIGDIFTTCHIPLPRRQPRSRVARYFTLAQRARWVQDCGDQKDGGPRSLRGGYTFSMYIYILYTQR